MKIDNFGFRFLENNDSFDATFTCRICGDHFRILTWPKIEWHHLRSMEEHLDYHNAMNRQEVARGKGGLV